MRPTYVGGFYGQLVSGAVWLVVAAWYVGLDRSGAHYLPFVFLYGMRLFAALAGGRRWSRVQVRNHPTISLNR